MASLSSHRPDLIEFDTLKRSNAHYNLQNAFNVAEKELGLTKLLDPEGESMSRPPQRLWVLRGRYPGLDLMGPSDPP